LRINKQFPLSTSSARAFKTLLLAALVGLTSIPALANGTSKPVARPVARLVSTSKQEVSAPTRARLLARAAVTTSSPAAAGAPRRAGAVAATSDERRAFELVNAERRARGRGPLVIDGELTRMARYHSENMARRGFFNHVDRDGLDLTGRASVLGLVGWKALGENIAYNQGYDDPTAFAVERWMISDKHRENILNREFTHAGIGIATASDGRVFFTQVFMTR
jgi:uncharacterized protein YkwD